MPPYVSIIVPCYNEQATIRLLLDAIMAQTYPIKDMEVVISDGISQDNTRTVIENYSRGHPGLKIRVIDNKSRSIPSSLNIAIKESVGDIIVRLDAHSIPIPEYVARCVSALEEGKGACVGGVWVIRPGGEGWIANSIAAAAANPLGVGDAMYRLEGKAGAVDTVPFGSFYRQLIGKIGAFDETLLTNEDYEFNTRIRQSGGIVWLDPQIRSTYIARASLTDLAKQYWRYGYWKYKMLIRYPYTLRWRQALPPLFVLSLPGLTLISIFSSNTLIFLYAEILIYLLILMGAGIHVAIRQHKPILIPGLMLAIMTMHVSWGSGFLWSLVSLPFKKT